MNVAFIFLLAALIYCSAGPGDRANRECRNNGLKMIECKRKLLGVKSRVPADILEFPHMTLVGFKSEKEGFEWKCGGSLISDFWVLTAAHCVNDIRLGPAVRLLFGKGTFEEEETEDLVQARKIVQSIKHPEYIPRPKYNDIALMKADKRVELNNHIRIACLDTGMEIPEKFIASGFGKTNYYDIKGSRTLMRVELEIVSAEACNKSHKNMIKKDNVLPRGILTNQLCAGDLENGGKDTCQGDSGGPLQTFPDNPDCRETFPLYVIVGVTSFGKYCGFKNSPGIYTKVSEYIPWIEDIVWPVKNDIFSK